MTREEAEREADRLLASPEARRKRARIESTDFTEAEGRGMWENVGRAWQPAMEAATAAYRDLGEHAGIQLGLWASGNKVRRYALDRITGVPVPSVKRFAAVQGVTETFVHRQIRMAEKLRGSLSTMLRTA